MDRIDPIAPDRSVQRVDLTYLTPLEREREKERRERERRRRAPQAGHQSAANGPQAVPEAPSGTSQNRAAAPSDGTSAGIDVRA